MFDMPPPGPDPESLEGRVQAALQRSKTPRTDLARVVVVVSKDVRVVSRTAAAQRIRKLDPGTAWLLERESPPPGSVVVFDREEQRVIVIDIPLGAVG
jgi:hypothetical protein